MNLLPDEQNIVRWIIQYGPLPKVLIYRLLHQKTERMCKKMMSNLQRWNYGVSLLGDVYFGTDRFCTPDQKVIQALWVLTRFAEKVDPNAHYPANPPAQVFFLKDGIGYEIIVLQKYEEHLVRLIQPTKGTKYIIVVPDVSVMDSLQLPEASYLFTTLDFCGGLEPQITFYSKEDAASG